ncbi:GNAT family N-acetyltransferase [Streptomyces sp. NPDC101221]|uniref:GNAT family N-acetyltransferase n=1 Tax=Streptomyces sp. NPDC101221 TaxID=3366132 RepID=UPI0038098A2E
MLAIEYRRHGGYEELRLVERPAEPATGGRASIRLSYAEVSPADDTIRAGRMDTSLHRAPPLIPGGGVGRITDPGATGLAEGTRVVVGGGGLGWRTDGTWREQLTAEAPQLIPIPDGVGDEAACALFAGAGYSTAYLVLTRVAGLKAGHTVLAPGIGGSVGMGTVEVARELGASLVLTTASRTDKAEQARAAGHQHVIDLSRESLADGVTRISTRWPDGRRGYLDGIVTDVPARGQGHARRIVDALVGHLHTAGIHYVQLHASNAGKPVYEAAGFVPGSYPSMDLVTAPPAG